VRQTAWQTVGFRRRCCDCDTDFSNGRRTWLVNML